MELITKLLNLQQMKDTFSEYIEIQVKYLNN